MEIYIAIAVILLIGIFAIGQFNQLVRLNNTVSEAFAQIEVQLRRRADLIPNLVETVKGYAADGMLTQALRGLLAVSEAYPDLKASANFVQLQEELAATENKVAFARQYYNDTVNKLNSIVEGIPGRFFTGLAKVTKREFYQIEDPEARNVPKVQF